MNRLYKVVFNKARGQYVVADEAAKSSKQKTLVSALMITCLLGGGGNR